jgi:hypothetical protein
VPRLTPSERSARARIAAHTRWARTDSAEASEAARLRQLAIFERQVDPDGTLDPAERTRRAEHARKAHMQRLAFQSAKARRARREATEKSKAS